MSESSTRLTLTPLKSTKAANSPFRSPFQKIKQSSDIENVQNDNCNTPTLQQMLSKKRRIAPSQSTTKKLCVAKDCENNKLITNMSISRSDLEALRKRVYKKQETVDNLKANFSSGEKSKAELLLADIKTWRRGCQEALERLRKDVQERNSETVIMNELLSILGIPASLVKFSIDDDAFED